MKKALLTLILFFPNYATNTSNTVYTFIICAHIVFSQIPQFSLPAQSEAYIVTAALRIVSLHNTQTSLDS